MSRILPFVLSIVLIYAGTAVAANPAVKDSDPKSPSGALDRSPLIPAPSDPAQWPVWREDLARWRDQTRDRLGYRDDLYRRADFGWVPSCYSCCFVMMCDETFYDRPDARYTIEPFLEHGARQFGGYDAVVLWHAYPRISFDDRNQFDFYRDMPGGLAGLRELSRTLHARGIKVFIDYNPWDTGTRREGNSDVDALAEIVGAIEADGIFLDTLVQGAAEFRAQLDAVRPGVVLEPELVLPVERIDDHHMSWAQGVRDSHAPGVLRNKWFERRHMMHQIKRWERDHTSELHTAWMNGSGMLVWENVFGTWVGWSGRDRSILRAMLPIQCRFVRLFSGDGWTPLVETREPDVYASLWEGDGIRLWTLVNRSEKSAQGTLLAVSHVDGARYFDLIAGREVSTVRNGKAFLEGAIRPRGIGAFVSGTGEALGADFPAFLARQARIERRVDFDTAFPALQETLKPVARTKRYRKAELPEGMASIAATTFDMDVQFRNRECGFYQTAAYRDTKPPLPNLHGIYTAKRAVSLSSYAIDRTPVTNGQFLAFLEATGYRPPHPENFLKHWKNGRSPPGLEDHPVVYVDLDDARAYATWARKRLPTEEEWQYAAQGPDGRLYPWGSDMQPDRCNDGAGGGTTSVTAFPGGRSPFGCYDMCGNVWEWTESERRDGRTRFCILRGGSFYRAMGSQWYADGGPQPCNFAAKFLLMWPGLDRCATIGFRCVVDLMQE